MRATALILAIATAGLSPASGQCLKVGTESFKFMDPDERAVRGVAATDDVLLVGMPFTGDGGVVQVFDAATGAHSLTLEPGENETNGGLGYTVAASGNIALASARWDRHDGDANVGSASLFDLSSGERLFKLTGVHDLPAGAFGRSVAVSERYALVGAVNVLDNGEPTPGSVYVYDVATGALRFVLTPPGGAEDDLFGIGVALTDDVAAIGASSASVAGANSGSVYLFDLETGAELGVISPDDAQDGQAFGLSVATSGTTIAVGAPGDDDVADNAGAVYVFDLETRAQTAKLVRPEDPRDSYFGRSVAVHGTLVGGGESVRSNVYIFDTQPAVRSMRLDVNDGPSGIRRSVAISSAGVVTGAEEGSAAFAAFFYSAPFIDTCDFIDLAVPCGDVQIQDVLTFIDAFSDSDPLADFAEPFGVLDLGDIDTLLVAYQACR